MLDFSIIFSSFVILLVAFSFNESNLGYYSIKETQAFLILEDNNIDNNITNSTPSYIVDLPKAYIGYGLDGDDLPLRFKSVINGNLTIINNPDFEFPIIGEESATLESGDPLVTPGTAWSDAMNKSIDVKNNASISPILKQERHGNVQQVGKPVELNKQINYDEDTFLLPDDIGAGHYVITLNKTLDDSVTGIYVGRIIINSTT